MLDERPQLGQGIFYDSHSFFYLLGGDAVANLPGVAIGEIVVQKGLEAIAGSRITCVQRFHRLELLPQRADIGPLIAGQQGK